ncbi:hypothetical protein [Selenomonas sp.]|uniref:hypothetical protein n=1 Tax=Selenomonas sp. TaxID=2053611 RepID=UPI003A100383
MFKVGMSLVLAVIAALVVFLAALVSGARISTVFLRSLVGFFLAGAVSWLVLFLLEAKGVVGFDRNLELPGEQEAEVPIGGEERIGTSEEDDGVSDEGVAAQPEAEDAGGPAEETAQFEPLAADDLTHVEAAPEEGKSVI